jgi:hypothetical protein
MMRKIYRQKIRLKLVISIFASVFCSNLAKAGLVDYDSDPYSSLKKTMTNFNQSFCAKPSGVCDLSRKPFVEAPVGAKPAAKPLDASAAAIPVGVRPQVASSQPVSNRSADHIVNPDPSDINELSCIPGCSALAGVVTKSSASQLAMCAGNLSQKYSRGNLVETKRAISAIQSPVLRNFIALTRTGMGEVDRRGSVSDFLGVFKSLANRARVCRTKDRACDTWDVATTPAQYSMYNSGIYQKNPVLTESARSSHMQKSISAFIEFQNLPIEKSWSSVFFYHATNVFPSWRKGKAIMPFSIGGKPLAQGGVHHLFYKDPRGWPEGPAFNHKAYRSTSGRRSVCIK